MPLLRKGRRKALFQTDRRKGIGASLCGDINKYNVKIVQKDYVKSPYLPNPFGDSKKHTI